MPMLANAPMMTPVELARRVSRPRAKMPGNAPPKSERSLMDCF